MSNINKNKKYHFIYKTTNLVNGKYYIGMHSTSNLKDGYIGSGKRLKYAIKKYGRSNFKFEVLEYCDTREILIEREKSIVTITLISDPLCMNLNLGGKGGFTSEVSRLGAIASNKKQRLLEQTDPDWVARKAAKLSAAHTGKVGVWKGKPGVFTGRTHSQLAKIKMSNAKKGQYVEASNSQFGTCWINKDNIYKKIPASQLSTYIEDGWSKGRKGYKNRRLL